MSIMSSAIVIVAVTAALLASSAAGQPEFVMAFLPKVNLSNYEVATLADLRSDAFVQQYNTIGLSFVQQMTQMCCVVSVAEGFLAFGVAGQQNGFIESFKGSQDVCTSYTQPQNTTFGIPPFAPGPYAGRPLPSINRTALELLHVNNSLPISYYGSQCANSKTYPFIAVFRRIRSQPSFIVQPYGPNFTAPVGYRQGALSDFISASFASYYNSNGILLSGINSNVNYCCMIRVTDGGWLTYGAENNFSPITLFTPSGYWSCGSSTNNMYHIFGTSFGGTQPNVLLPRLNATSLPLVGYFTNDTAQDFDGCNLFPDSLTFFVQN